jgi:aryl-alcohol dehydrogenase-like predicted oxidoreductase
LHLQKKSALILVFITSVEELAQKKGITMAQVALAWSFAKPGTSRSPASVSISMFIVARRGDSSNRGNNQPEESP